MALRFGTAYFDPMTPTPRVRFDGKECPECGGPIVASAGNDWHCDNNPKHKVASVIPPICQECGQFMIPTKPTTIYIDGEPNERPSSFVECANGHSQMV